MWEESHSESPFDASLIIRVVEAKKSKFLLLVDTFVLLTNPPTNELMIPFSKTFFARSIESTPKVSLTSPIPFFTF